MGARETRSSLDVFPAVLLDALLDALLDDLLDDLVSVSLGVLDALLDVSLAFLRGGLVARADTALARARGRARVPLAIERNSITYGSARSQGAGGDGSARPSPIAIGASSS
jgi:hypothetical protein